MDGSGNRTARRHRRVGVVAGWQRTNRTLRVLALGGVGMSMMLGGGLFAVLSDSAEVGQNSIQTGELPVVEDQLDIQVAQAVDNGCQDPALQWQDISIPGVFQSDDFPVGEGSRSITSDPWCIRRVDTTDNVMAISATIADFSEADPVCSAGEEAAGDTDCGVPGSDVGEVSDVVSWNARVDFNSETCDHGSSSPAGLNQALAPGATTSMIGLQPGQTFAFCMWFELFTNTTDPGLLGRLQTDLAFWDWTITGSI